MSNPVQQAQKLGQSIWYDNVRRGLLTSGELKRLIEEGITGLTSNPTIFEKAIAGSTDYDQALLSLVQGDTTAKETYEALVLEDIRGAADILRPIYDRTGGADGYASLEVSPALAHDTEGTVAEAMRLHAALNRPNVMIKVPATAGGIPAVRVLIGEGIGVNVTLIFSLDTHKLVMEAYMAGLEDLARSGGDLAGVASVASFFLSRVDTAVDALLDEKARQGSNELASLMGKAAVSNAKLAYRAFRDTFDSERFASLKAGGARVQRPLWASTGTKNPAYSDVLYLESLIGPDTVNTVPPATLTAFLEHGKADATLDQDASGARTVLDSLEAIGIDMRQVTDGLLTNGLNAFADSFDKLLTNIQEKKTQLLAHDHPGDALGVYLSDVEATLDTLQQDAVVDRIWRRDHTVWRPDPREISDRLGWLTVTDLMCDQVPNLQSFAAEVRVAGFRHVVLLGMGGSSLGPEVLRQTFGSAPGYPELIVLDTTIPAWIKVATDAIDPGHTLFLVSSKSGGTIEPMSAYSYFRSLVEEAVGSQIAGQSFVAVTDPGTSLDNLAQEEGFRRIFLNPPDIGGRYSVLSYFGLVPAALMGLDLAKLLDRADSMREGCASCVPEHDNPGARLGAVLGSLALKGRDKLTLVTSPSISAFGLWIEQLIAESTGKEGKGIVPVAGETLAGPDSYGDDRLFVHLRLEGDDNAATDDAMERIEASGHPVLRLDLRDRYDLGAEFFRWEFATAVAGAVLDIQPFDQPNVQLAKDVTGTVLSEHLASGRLPASEAPESVTDLLSRAQPGDYLAIMAYLQPTPENDRALIQLRDRVVSRYRIATTLGYGPRFLHSTGQLHKGGPDTGLFLQITAGHKEDVQIPGAPYTFGTLADAQALGDLRVLQQLGRRVARIQLGQDYETDLRALVGRVG